MFVWIFHRISGVALIFLLVIQFSTGFLQAAAVPADSLTAETYGLSGGSVSLLLFWCLIVFLVVYLRRLLQENTRIRKLYQAEETNAEFGSGNREVETSPSELRIPHS